MILVRHFILTFFLATSVIAFGQYEEQLKSIDNYISKAIDDWNIPGAAIAIVKDGEIILEKGYGIKSVETKEHVDEHSLFAIASNSKAYTAAALAQLVDQEKLSWNDKVKKHLPYFQLYDEWVSDQMTIKDLLCHRSGLKTFSGDLLWYGTDYTREEVIKRAKYLQPTYDFRTDYGYQNIMFITAGEVVAAVSGMSWDEYIKQNFLSKLDMDNTLTTIRDFNAKTNKSEPHNEIDGKNETIDWVNWDNIGGAGALISSAHDASQWLKLQLNKGTWDEEEFWKEEQSNLMWTVHTPKKLSKQSVMVPEEKLGFIFMTNNNNSLSYAMMYQILDAFYAPDDYEATDWGQMLLEYKKDGVIKDAESLKKLKEERLKDTKPSAKISNYAGYYEDVMYGGLTIVDREGVLYFSFDHTALFKGNLNHWQDDTFRLHWSTKMMLPAGMANFEVDENGKVIQLIIDVPNPDFDFTEFTFMKKNKVVKMKKAVK